MPQICEKGGHGLIFPLGRDDESTWPKGLRIILYLFGLCYTFAGVAIIADVFMAAIEKVTSRKLRLWDKERQRFYTFELWNATVANLTLMALGSSAPEIMLNVIDIFAKEFFLEGLGPGTIVGSAAFNLLMIIAVCIVSIPSGQVRFIKELPVYIVTASCSIFAYLWLLFILVGTSPNVVEVWEGVLTFLFFPMIVLVAWVADKGYLGGSKKADDSRRPYEDMSPEHIAEMEANIRRNHGEHLTNEQVARVLSAMDEKPNSRAAYRIGATHAMFGGKRLKVAARQSFSKKFSFIGRGKVAPLVVQPEEENDAPPVCYFSFSARKYAIFENAGTMVLPVIRGGDCSMPAKVYFETKDGTAKSGEDFKANEGWVEFAAGQLEATIEVEIIDDDAYEDNEDFFVTLSKPQVSGPGDEKLRASLGEIGEAQVMIIDDDDAGMLCFESDHIKLNPPQTKDQAHFIMVRRMGGGSGDITVHYAFEGDTAVKGRDFEGADGELAMANGEMEGCIKVTLKAVARYATIDHFRIVLSEPTGGATLDDTKDGGAEKNILTVMIESDSGHKDRLDRLKSTVQVKLSKSAVGHRNYAQQFKDAIFVNGGDDDEDYEPPTKRDYIVHIVTCPWKFLFAIVPPTDYCGGWVCFFSALLMIGFVTMLISDLASLLGCVLCLPDDITAITFVALGTSLPDTFASKNAAEQDPYADASVGNVTGSNCVNVFLGLGLPWMIASIRWQISGKTAAWEQKYAVAEGLDWLGVGADRKIGFVVMAGSLGFSVAVFSCCAVLSLMLLAVRRSACGGELGGSAGSKWLSAGFLTFLWFLYIALSAGQSISEKGISCPS